MSHATGAGGDAASSASRSGVPIEIVNKVILRHANLATTQICLGRVSDEEAFKLSKGNKSEGVRILAGSGI